MSDNLIQFPRPPIPEDKAPWNLTDQRFMVKCEGIIHVYAETPGRCQCGEQWWDGSTEQPSAGGESHG